MLRDAIAQTSKAKEYGLAVSRLRRLTKEDKEDITKLLQLQSQLSKKEAELFTSDARHDLTTTHKNWNQYFKSFINDARLELFKADDAYLQLGLPLDFDDDNEEKEVEKNVETKVVLMLPEPKKPQRDKKAHA